MKYSTIKQSHRNNDSAWEKGSKGRKKERNMYMDQLHFINIKSKFPFINVWCQCDWLLNECIVMLYHFHSTNKCIRPSSELDFVCFIVYALMILSFRAIFGLSEQFFFSLDFSISPCTLSLCRQICRGIYLSISFCIVYLDALRMCMSLCFNVSVL